MLQTRITFLWCLLTPTLLSSSLAHAAPASFSADKGALLCGAGGQQEATWNGACKDGLAHGAGTATWTDGTTPNKLDGTLERGNVSGVATLVYGDMTYIGTFLHFEAHGQGFFKYPDGGMYEGGIDNGKFQGPGIFQSADRSRYEGEWVADRQEGQGRATFALGGSYEGHWHHGKFDGLGTIVYAGSGRTYTGQFKEGRPVDGSATAAPSRQDDTYRIRQREASLGSYIPEVVSNNSPFSGVPWAEMSDGERAVYKRAYAALAEGDEPPYPVNGIGPIVRALGKMQGTSFGYTGAVRMTVLVAADGKAKSASTVGKVDAEAAKLVGHTLMLTNYKPARCDGKPCEMLFTIAFRLY